MLCFFMEKVVHIYVYMYGIHIPNLLTAQNKNLKKKAQFFKVCKRHLKKKLVYLYLQIVCIFYLLNIFVTDFRVLYM